MDWKDILAGLSVPDSAEAQSNSGLETNNTTKPSKKKVKLFFERKGRHGKSVTILADFEGVDADEIERLASWLKQRLGAGGSTRDGEILIQGDRREQIRKLLTDKEYTVC